MDTVFDIQVDYEKDYVETYHGRMSKEDFETSLLDAVSEVDDAIWPNSNLAAHEAKIKLAICAVADAIGNRERRLKSYTAGKVREEYGTAGFSLTAAAAIKRWLGGTGILKQGHWL